MWNKLKKFWYQRNLQTGQESEIHASCNFVNIKDIKIGDYVYIGANTFLEGKGGISIDHGTILSSNITILSSTHDFLDLNGTLPYSLSNIYKKVTIGKGCWIGMNVTILPGVTIGHASIIGAGSVVTKDVSEGSIVAGNPAKIIKKRDSSQIKTLLNNEKFLLKEYGRNRRK